MAIGLLLLSKKGKRALITQGGFLSEMRFCRFLGMATMFHHVFRERYAENPPGQQDAVYVNN